MNNIDGKRLEKTLSKYGVKISGGLADKNYQLPTLPLVEKFVSNYRDNNTYSLDDYDCDDYAWIMRAEFLKKFMGIYPFGYIESTLKSIINNYNHAFNFCVTDDLKIWYCDPLGMVSDKGKLIEAYPVKCNMAKM